MKLIYLIFFLIICQIGYNQSHLFYHYTIEDGLPSSEVYSAFQDSNGYMWFATDAGVSRFNGYEFQNFDVSNGLTDNTIFLITEDNEGRIWFGSFNSRLAYYEKGNIYPYRYNNNLDIEIIKNKIIVDFKVTKDKLLWLSFIGEGIIKLDSLGQTSKVPVRKSINSQVNIIDMDSIIFWGYESAIDTNKNKENTSFPKETDINIESIDKTYHENKKLIYDYRYTSIGNVSVNKYKKGLLVFLGKDSYYYQDKKNNEFKRIKVPEFFKEMRVFSVYTENENIWISTDREGAYKARIKNDSLIILDNFLPNVSVSRTFKDNKDQYWFQTLEDGIYFYKNKNIRNVEWFNGKNITALSIDTVNDNIYVALEKGKIFKYNNLSVSEIFSSPLPTLCLKYMYDKKQLFIGGYNKGICLYKNNKVSYKDLSKFNYGFKSLIAWKDTIYKANDYGVSEIINGNETFFSYTDNSQKMWCTSLLKEKDKVLIGTNNGIEILKNHKISNPYEKNKILSSAITDVKRLNGELIIIGTKSFGAVIMKGDSVVKIIDEENGLSDNLIRKIHVDNQNNIWIATNSGLSKIKYVNNKYSIYNFNKKTGYPILNISDIVSSGNFIYVATNKGLLQINKNEMYVDSTTIPLHISQLLVNGTELAITNNLIFNYNQNEVDISYEALNYGIGDNTEYLYCLEGSDNRWITTSLRNIHCSSLSPGDYTFKIEVKNGAGIWSEPVTLSFSISSPFWITWWFITLEIIFGIIIIYTIFKFREKRIQMKSEAEKRLVELELIALRAQMNPHFIFNTLNTIQNAINTLDKRIASDYIANFGRLIRIVLETSKSAKILLNTEIEMLSLYMELEALRFSNKFSFKITKDQIFSEKSFYVPSMVVQPFVENAILHGLIPKDDKNLNLIIDFKLGNNSTIICTVEDNGIGRDKSKEISNLKKINKKSMGIEITKERLKIYNRENTIGLTIIDLKGKDGDSLGTKVEMIFPLQD